VFNHPFREVGREYLLIQEARAINKGQEKTYDLHYGAEPFL